MTEDDFENEIQKLRFNLVADWTYLDMEYYNFGYKDGILGKKRIPEKYFDSWKYEKYLMGLNHGKNKYDFYYKLFMKRLLKINRNYKILCTMKKRRKDEV